MHFCVIKRKTKVWICISVLLHIVVSFDSAGGLLKKVVAQLLGTTKLRGFNDPK